MPAQKKLTDKEKLFCEKVFNKQIGKNKKSNAQIVQEVYNIGSKTKKKKRSKEEVSRLSSEIASQNLAKPQIKNELQRLYNKVGLTKELVSSALVEDIKAKPQKRVRELELASRVLGMQQQTAELSEKELYHNDQYEVIAERITERIKQKKA